MVRALKDVGEYRLERVLRHGVVSSVVLVVRVDR